MIRFTAIITALLVGPSLGASPGVNDINLEIFKQSLQKSSSIPTLLEYLNKNYNGFMKNHTLVYKSQSLQAASPLKPRAIVFGDLGHLIMAFNDSQGIEIMTFQDDEFQFREVLYRKNKSELPIPKEDVDYATAHFVVSKPNLPKCMACHKNAMPNWNTYSFWPGVYGSDDDLLTRAFFKELTDFELKYFINGPASQGRNFIVPPKAKDRELTQYISYLRSKPHHPHYQHLPSRPSDRQLLAWSYGTPYEELKLNSPDPEYFSSNSPYSTDRPNGAFTFRLSLNLSKALLKKALTLNPVALKAVLPTLYSSGFKDRDSNFCQKVRPTYPLRLTEPNRSDHRLIDELVSYLIKAKLKYSYRPTLSALFLRSFKASTNYVDQHLQFFSKNNLRFEPSFADDYYNPGKFTSLQSMSFMLDKLKHMFLTDPRSILKYKEDFMPGPVRFVDFTNYSGNSEIDYAIWKSIGLDLAQYSLPLEEVFSFENGTAEETVKLIAYEAINSYGKEIGYTPEEMEIFRNGTCFQLNTLALQYLKPFVDIVKSKENLSEGIPPKKTSSRTGTNSTRPPGIGSSDKPIQTEYSEGRSLYRQHCAECHGLNGDGYEQYVPALSHSTFLKRGQLAIENMVLKGSAGRENSRSSQKSEGMPAIDVNPEQARAIAEYVLERWGKN